MSKGKSMSWREPEYIDDDDFHDPEGGSNVLGGSGSRSAGGDFDQPAAGGRNRKHDKNTAASKAYKARNPAPSVASSEERRARLAGKHTPGKTRMDSPADAPDKGESERKRRLGGLRARISRGESGSESRSIADAGKNARLGKAAGSIGRFLRGRFRSSKARVATAEAPPTGAAGSRSGGGRGASRPAQQSRASKTPKIESSDWLDLDRKLDLIGVALVFGAIVFVLSALSPERAAIGGLHRIVGQLLGWGVIALPLAMFSIGMWLIVRHFGEQAPIIDPIRLFGVALAFLGALVSLQYFDSLGYPSSCGPGCMERQVEQAYLNGEGGGLVGGWLYSALVSNLTEIGGFVVALMVLTFAAMMITRSSMAEMAVVSISLSRSLRTRLSQYAVKRRAARLQAQQQGALTAAEGHVRVSRPQPPQLAASPVAGRALPEPSAETMPIPVRLRELFGRRADADATMEPASQARAPGIAQRLLNRNRRQGEQFTPATDSASKTGPVAALERFLNLGDDLPPTPSAAPVIERPPARPGPHKLNPEWRSTSRPSPPPVREIEPTPVAPPAQPEAPPAYEPPAAIDSASARPGADASDDAPDNEGGKKNTAENVAALEKLKKSRIEWEEPDYRELLSSGTASDLDQEPLRLQAQIIEETLAAFGAPGRVVETNSGPVITQYGVEPAYLTAKTGKRSRVKVSAIAKLDKDLQLALGARSLRMEAPVPGRGYVGIEVPNPAAARVGLRDVMDSKAYQKIESPLAIALGMSVDGQPIAADLAGMPHLLIAGTTGSGKSVCVNAIINSILANNSPETVRFIMVDPKRVELTGYNGLPHLVAPVVVDLERIIGVLRWVTTEMDERYTKFSRAGARHIIDYNSMLDPDLAAMPYIVVIIDELADLMMMAQDDTERAISRITAMARATGIHLVIATQRPSVDVVTGLIKANCPARIAFAVASSVDSRVIIDQPGAERLLGKGDMLYLSGDAPAPLRAQGVHVSNDEINRIARYWKLQGAGVEGVAPIPLPPKSEPSAQPPADTGGSQSAFWDMAPKSDGPGNAKPDEDELYQTAVEMVRRLEKASISLLQRRLRIGYTRAARLMDMMEERGVVGPPKEGSSKPRDVLPP
ncbi:MAG: DNA translocase FtsK [Chloroflexi bacterium]|nr:DNA translocase FtsK [Chloroflexota bacterium]